MVYQPMLELLAYLRANGFKTFIVSGGGIEFMRPWAEKVYGIPPEQVVGSSVKTKFELRDGKPVLMRLPEVDFIDDKAGKPVGIQSAHRPPSDRRLRQLRRRPADAAMDHRREPARASALLVHHDDAEREFAYDRKSHVGKLDHGLDEAPRRGWLVVSMKNDWAKASTPGRSPDEVAGLPVLGVRGFGEAQKVLIGRSDLRSVDPHRTKRRR